MILFTGRGTSGSWKVRGEQLGAACNATVNARASAEDIQRADLVYVVKRLTPDLIKAIKGRPWVWDIVDAYPQPMCTNWSRDEAIDWVRSTLSTLKPTAVIWPNERMRDDCDTGIPGLVLRHHFRPDIVVNPIRPQAQTVGYEGCETYIGEWLKPIGQACKERGLRFVINPSSLAEVDIVIACRSSEHNGYAQRHWKSNVKLANAHGSGTPFIGPKECGYLETATGLEQWAESPDAIGHCLDVLESFSKRQAVHHSFLHNRYSVEDAAAELMPFLESLWTD